MARAPVRKVYKPFTSWPAKPRAIMAVKPRRISNRPERSIEIPARKTEVRWNQMEVHRLAPGPVEVNRRIGEVVVAIASGRRINIQLRPEKGQIRNYQSGEHTTEAVRALAVEQQAVGLEKFTTGVNRIDDAITGEVMLAVIVSSMVKCHQPYNNAEGMVRAAEERETEGREEARILHEYFGISYGDRRHQAIMTLIQNREVIVKMMSYYAKEVPGGEKLQHLVYTRALAKQVVWPLERLGYGAEEMLAFGCAEVLAHAGEKTNYPKIYEMMGIRVGNKEALEYTVAAIARAMSNAISIYRSNRDVPVYISDQALKSHGYTPTNEVLASAAALEKKILQEEGEMIGLNGTPYVVGRVMAELGYLYPS